MGRIGAVLPLQDEPEYQGRAERRERIDLALDGREPERVAPGVDQGAAEARAEDDNHLAHRHLGGIVVNNQLLDQMSDGPEQQQYCGGRQQARHSVDHQGHLGDVAKGEVDGEARSEHEDGVARRMAYFELVALCYKLGAVPEAGCRFERQHVCHRSDDKAEPAETVVNQIVSFHFRVNDGQNESVTRSTSLHRPLSSRLKTNV